MTSDDPSGERDTSYMRRALDLATRGWGRVAPNPLVGAVVVAEDEIVGEGWHAEFGGAHAEVVALQAAGERARGATLYVTLEPCSHWGKTPPCTTALLDAGVSKVVFASHDPDPTATGGAQLLASHGLQVLEGVEREAADRLNARFFHMHSGARRPWIELKLALTLDARMADHSSRSFWITGREARAEVHRLRAGHDAVAVGIGTALQDDPVLTVRDAPAPRVPPARVVFDRLLRLPVVSRLVSSIEAAPLFLVHSGAAPEPVRRALEDAGARLVESETLADGLARLRKLGIASVFCEGGATLATSFLRDDLVDRLTLFYAPTMLGPGGRSPFAGLPDVDVSAAARWRAIRRTGFGDDTLISFEH